MRKLTVGDMFCGAGGTSHGLVNSKMVDVAWAIDHDPNCIKTHKKNHPHTKHYEEDIVSMDIKQLCKVDLLWASLECTHFSQAKGGQSRDADSRMLANQMFRYIRQTNPTFIVIENVKEFLTNGPLIQKTTAKGIPIYQKKKGVVVLDQSGNPIPVMIPDPKRKGEHYREWVDNIKKMGYSYSYKLMNSADYGAPTTRLRYFGTFVKKGYKIAFPKQTHSKDGKNGFLKWNPCKPYIDLTNEGNSIFGRKFNQNLPKNVRKPLADNTIKRIVAGVKKFCIKNDLIYDEKFILKYYGTGDNTNSIDGPLHTITTKDRHVLVSLEKQKFVTEHFGTTRMIDQPMPTIMAYKDQKYVVTVEYFTTQNYIPTREGNERADSLLKPLKTISTANIHSLVNMEKMHFIQKYFNSNGNPSANVSSIDSPIGSMTTKLKESLVTVEKKYDYLIDIKTRFLTADELKVIQGFSPSYHLIGNQGVQKKAIGNSVVPFMAQKIVEQLYITNKALLK